MRQVLRSRIVLPVVILVMLIVLILGLVARWQGSSGPPAARSGADVTSSESAGPGSTEDRPVVLDAWKRPDTTDPSIFAMAYARAIWTYDSTIHTFDEWRDAVSVFADPSGEAPRIARSMLPYLEQWQQLALHRGSAAVTNITATSSPELRALERDPRAPAGWHGFLVHGQQKSIVDGEPSTATRQVTVGVVCLPTCRFWSATAEGPR
jgi:hypothetical protein